MVTSICLGTSVRDTVYLTRQRGNGQRTEGLRRCRIGTTFGAWHPEELAACLTRGSDSLIAMDLGGAVRPDDGAGSAAGGADPSVVDDSGRTALEYARRNRGLMNDPVIGRLESARGGI